MGIFSVLIGETPGTGNYVGSDSLLSSTPEPRFCQGRQAQKCQQSCCLLAAACSLNEANCPIHDRKKSLRAPTKTARKAQNLTQISQQLPPSYSPASGWLPPRGKRGGGAAFRQPMQVQERGKEEGREGRGRCKGKRGFEDAPLLLRLSLLFSLSEERKEGEGEGGDPR